MTHFVRNGEHVVNSFLIVQQHERVNAVHAPRIRAASLASVLEHVYPTALECVCENVRIFLARDFKRVFDKFDRVFVFERKFLLAYDRRVKVVHIECFDAQNFLSERDVIVQGLRAFADRFEKFVVASGRNVLVVHRVIERTLEASHLCVKPVFFNVAGIVCGNGVDVVFVRREHTLESVLSHSLVGALQKHTVHAVTHRHFVAVFVLDWREFNVGVVEHRENFSCVVREQPDFAEQFFLFL